MLSNIAFFPRNIQHANFFSKVATHIEKQGVKCQFVREEGTIPGFKTFEFERKMAEIWDSFSSTDKDLNVISHGYPDFDFCRAIYSEREFNFFPEYFGSKVVSREFQLKYLSACFSIFESWLEESNVDGIFSELVIGMPDAILKAVAEKKGVKYYSVRQSKMTKGIVVCDKYYDEPIGMREFYKDYLENDIPLDVKDEAVKHISDLRNKIQHPAYMELTKKPLKLFSKYRIRTFFDRLFKTKISVFSTSRVKHPIIKPVMWSFRKYWNIIQTNFYYSKYFYAGSLAGIKYFIFPLHYEPESSTSVRAFCFSDQLATIKLLSKILPPTVQLVVKEHGGNQGYRKANFYRELSYMPNVIMLAADRDVSGLLKECLGVMTLTGRMGWESLVNNKPVICFGKSFWSWHKNIYRADSVSGLKAKIQEISQNKDNKYMVDEDELLAFTSSYIRCTHKGMFVLNAKGFSSDANIKHFSNILMSL
jgi:hypothetical protein